MEELRSRSAVAMAVSAPALPPSSSAPTVTDAGEPDSRPTARPSGVTSAPVTPTVAVVPDPTTDADPAPSAGVNGRFTVNFAGDVNFAERTADRLAADPRDRLRGGRPRTGRRRSDHRQPGNRPSPPAAYRSRSPSRSGPRPRRSPRCATAGVDVGLDGEQPWRRLRRGRPAGQRRGDRRVRFPVIGMGADRRPATAPFRTSINGVDLEIFAATAVHDHTLEAGRRGELAGSGQRVRPGPGRERPFSGGGGATVVVFLHWGTEYDSCPDERPVADRRRTRRRPARPPCRHPCARTAGRRLAARRRYVAYGLSNYLWWRSFGNEQDDNGVLTLTFEANR